MRNADSENKIASFKVKQGMPYEFKVNYARIRAWEFYNECGKRDLDCYVSVGGLDSITLFFFLKSIGIDVPAVSVSSLEDIPFCICQCRTSSHSFIKRKNLAISAPSRSWIIARLAFHSMQQERRFGGSAAPAGFSFPDLPRMGAGRRGAGRTPPDRRTPRPRKATASWRCCRQGR